jgi:hypothetical protein
MLLRARKAGADAELLPAGTAVTLVLPDDAHVLDRERAAPSAPLREVA